jgi:hypothetical protein
MESPVRHGPNRSHFIPAMQHVGCEGGMPPTESSRNKRISVLLLTLRTLTWTYDAEASRIFGRTEKPYLKMDPPPPNRSAIIFSTYGHH